MRTVRFATLLTLALLAVPFGTTVAQGVDIIRGRVTGPENQPLEAVQVTVTTISGAVSRSARTDQNGRYTVTFPGGDGDYFVTFNSIGLAQRRFEIKRVADEEILVADAKMSRAIQALGEVRVQATERARPNRNDISADIGGAEQQVNQSALSAAQQGDLAAMAASLPGTLLIPGADGDPSGFSVLGLDPSQNSTTLNGLSFGGADIPRDAVVSSMLSSAPYDVSRGGFSGATFGLRTQSGTNFKVRTASLNADAPQMQWTDQAARALGQQYTNLSLSGRLSGPIRYNESFFNLAYQLGRRSNDLQTLLNTDPLGLETSGIAADSVTRLLRTLNTLGVPAVAGRLPNDRLTDQGSLLGSFDFAPPSSRAGSAYNVTLTGSWNRISPISNLTNELPAHSGDRTSWNTGAQFRHSTYFGVGILSETSIGVSGSNASSDPYLLMPGGSVLINSDFASGASGVKYVAFGGNAALGSSASNRTAGLTNLLSWFSEDNKHRIKLSTELRRDSYALDQNLNRLGTFTFNSLADLQAGRPLSYTRTLQPRARDGSQVVGAVSLGDSYRGSNNFQVQYGVRLDGNAFDSRPAFNAQVEQLFGARNDVVPNRLYVSPRVGFSWSYGTAAQVGSFLGAFRGPRATVRGGVGVFQGTPGVQATGAALDNTGLATGLQQVVCTGAAAPAPAWPGYAAGAAPPSQCADGSTGTAFASTAPNVSLFAKDYAAPRSIRSNLNWSGAILGNRFNGQFEVTYSLNLNQGGSLDLNFAPVQRFTLPDEADRPVYVQVAGISPQTGGIAPGGARVSQLFNRVTESRSDLRSESRQFRASLSPLNFSSAFQWNLSYVYTTVRERTRGFGGNTAGNPLDYQWSRASLDSRHQIQYLLNYNAFDLIRLTWFGTFRSGTPFTPLVAADVNGDGYANDRAFIFGAGAANPALGAAMSALMGSAPSYVRDCLRRQVGTVAGRNSCEGPWTAQANLSISFNPVKVGMPQRANISFSVQNPLGAADLLLNGDNHLRGWGQNAIPDPNLLYVRGFDAANKRFSYVVNQRFGATSPQLTPFRTPVVATAMFRFDLGPTREEQALTQQLNIGRRSDGPHLSESVLKSIYATGGGLANPIATILRQSDSLQLTSKQADSLATLNRWYMIRLDSIWSPIVKSLAALPDQYDEGAAYRVYKSGREGSVDLLRRLAPQVKGLLDDAQRRKLPPLVTSYLDQRYLASIRSGTAGAAGSPFAGVGTAGGAATSVMMISR
ncbi:MAG: carboxypeptidase regulatory-like domain-containing protein [Gemmatimonadaceae bacterium]|nr:carboxypeptidase regulatory-like domain-containing protein [Gemmatimonadaceae bacterium]